MKRSTKLCLAGLVILLTSCFEREEFPTVPNIEFEDLRFFLRPESREDSLVLSFRFEDGDGDLGLDPTSDVLPPYHDFFVFIDSRDTLATISNESELVPPFFSVPATKTNIDLLGVQGTTLIPGPINGSTTLYIYEFLKEPVNGSLIFPEYDCEFYDIVNLPNTFYSIDGNFIIPEEKDIFNDTLLISRNELSFNIHIDILRKLPNGEFEEFFLSSRANIENCGVGELDARFPIFIGDGSGREGLIDYQTVNSQFVLGFQDDTYRFSFYIYDRAGNRSNIVETEEFVLADITQ